MTAMTAGEARANLYRLIDEAASSYQPLLIAEKRNNAVLVSEEDWEAIQPILPSDAAGYTPALKRRMPALARK